MSVFVIAGITGHTGSVAAGELLAQGEKVRAIVRNEQKGAAWRKSGAELAVGTLEDAAFLARTLAGADGFFVLLPPNPGGDDFYQAQRRIADRIAPAVKESAVPHVVMLSSVGAELAEGTGPIKGLHYLEEVLRATGTKLTAIRASFFQENIASIIPAARQMGIYPNFLPPADFAIPMIATEDIGRLAAKLLKSPPPSSEAVDLAGPEYSARQLSDKLGAALGKPLRIVDIPPAGHIEALTQAGVPLPTARVLAEMYGALGSGLIRANGDRRVEGTTPIDGLIAGLVAQPASGHS
jgi:uncharacterized protein YbjT (DUF2867 family)